jgi:hypothetical protein
VPVITRIHHSGRDPAWQPEAYQNRETASGADLWWRFRCVRAYILNEAFQQLWEYNSPAWTGKFLDEWCRQTMRPRIDFSGLKS